MRVLLRSHRDRLNEKYHRRVIPQFHFIFIKTLLRRERYHDEHTQRLIEKYSSSSSSKTLRRLYGYTSS